MRVEDVFGSNIKGLNTAGYNGQGDQIFFQDTDTTAMPDHGIRPDLQIPVRKIEESEKTNGSFGKEQFRRYYFQQQRRAPQQ
ncbi:hypothetical protein [Persicobacter diffluens]|uniref:hypothetical protein n=1 Tax=Persicobacter diffluens TaxID=981 RepID=UPI0030C71BD8